MNICALSSAANQIIFKAINKSGGVSVFEWMLFRNLFNLVAISVLLYSRKINPIRDAPKKEMNWLWLRGVIGQTSFGLTALSLSLIPITLHMIIY